jgi:8-oxo-dGTP pyrophosphatase MutT (NUDIX family)
MASLLEQIQRVSDDLSKNQAASVRFKQRLRDGLLTRDENLVSHFCIYFLPYNPKTRQVFIVHHKKSGFWLSPGGHIDKEELLLDALNREIKEELGVENYFSDLPKPLLITIAPIKNIGRSCKEHLDIWFLLETDGANFNLNPEEFHETKWLTLSEAKNIITEHENLRAIEEISSMYFLSGTEHK